MEADHRDGEPMLRNASRNVGEAGLRINIVHLGSDDQVTSCGPLARHGQSRQNNQDFLPRGDYAPPRAAGIVGR